MNILFSKAWKCYFCYAAFAMIMVALFSGCGNLVPTGNRDFLPQSVIGMGNALTGNGIDNYLCPVIPNVIPKTGGFDNPVDQLRSFDWYMDGTGHFTACKNQINPGIVKIEGEVKFSKTVCVFPALERKDRPDLGPLFYPTASGAVYSCRDLRGQGNAIEGYAGTVEIGFSNINYNYIIVVEAPFVALMETCITAGSASYCPGATEDSGYFSAGRIE